MWNKAFVVFLTEDENRIKSIIDVTDEYTLLCDIQEPEVAADDIREKVNASMLVMADDEKEVERKAHSMLFT